MAEPAWEDDDHSYDCRQGDEDAEQLKFAVNPLVMFEIFYLFKSRYIKANVLNLNDLLGNRYALITVGVRLCKSR